MAVNKKGFAVFFSTLLVVALLLIPGNATNLKPSLHHNSLSQGWPHLLQTQLISKGQIYSKRKMIGSTMPTCTYNECRGCKYKCRAEQVPVDGNDPISSAYHYRCVCQR